MGGDKNKDNGNSTGSSSPREITKECNICGQDVTARPGDIFTAMAVHKAMAHGNNDE